MRKNSKLIRVRRSTAARIRPESKSSRLEQLKVFAGGLGLDPERCIAEGAFAEPHRAFVSGDLEAQQIALLSSAIKDDIKQDIKQDILAELGGFESAGVQGQIGGAARIRKPSGEFTDSKKRQKKGSSRGFERGDL